MFYNICDLTANLYTNKTDTARKLIFIGNSVLTGRLIDNSI